jgi:hypothetical protein
MNASRAARDHSADRPPARGASRTPAPGRAASGSTPLIDALGNQAVLRLMGAGSGRGKRPADTPSDPSELHADRVAGALAGGGAASDCGCDCGTCNHGKQRPSTGGGVISSLLGPGQPLAPVRQSWFEERLGIPLDSVRVHTDERAADSAAALRAQAYTVGDDVVFRRGGYAPDDRKGLELLSHELAHVAEQRTTGPRLALKPDDAPAETEDEAGEVEEQWLALIEEISEDIEEITTGTGEYLDLDQGEMLTLRARTVRKLVILTSFRPESWEEFQALHVKMDAAAETEEQTLEAIKGFGARAVPGDPLHSTRGFPATWAKRLEQAMRPVLDPAEMGRRLQAASDALRAAGERVPAHLVAHGLPVDFDTAMDLKSFTVHPGHLGLPAGNPLRDFAAAGAAYAHAYADAQLATRYAGAIRSLIADVAAGERIIDPTVFEEYAHDRRWAPTPADLFRWNPPVNPKAEADEVNPYLFERTMYETLSPIRFLDLLVAGGTTRTEFERRLGEADRQIAALDAYRRLYLARAWAGERGYGSYVRSVLWEQLKDAMTWDTVKEAAKEGAKSAILLSIPVVNWFYGAYLVGKAAVGVGEAIMGLSDAEDAARSAKSVVALQRASARLTLAEHTEIIKLAASLLDVFGSWAALRAALRARPSVPKAPAEKARTKADEPVRQKKAEEPRKEPRKEEPKKDPIDPVAERAASPANPIDLPGQGKAHVTPEGRCKICRSPCRFMLDQCRDALREAARTPQAAYLENLLKRIQRLEEAMEEAIRSGASRADFRSRFQPAFHKLANEADAAYARFVQRDMSRRLPAADEIEASGAGSRGDILDDPKRYEHTGRAEQKVAGTRFHDHIKAELLRAFPKGTVFTEDTIKEFLKREGIDPSKVILRKKRGIDVYVFDSRRNLITPVDITHVAGAPAHVAKLQRDWTKLEGGLKGEPIYVTEPYEIEYAGMTFDQAAASIIAELRPYAR